MISKEEVKKLAALARMKITPEEEETLTKEVDSIIDYVAQVQKVSGTSGAKGDERIKNVLREDKDPLEPGAYTKEILDNAPKREGDYIKVKKIL